LYQEKSGSPGQKTAEKKPRRTIRKLQPNHQLTSHALLSNHFKHINLSDNGQKEGRLSK
jgi:hypothetical protein